MSKGHGSRQRPIIDALTAHATQHPPMGDFDADGQLLIACYKFELDHEHRDVPRSFLTAEELSAGDTRSALESTKRALRKLASAGIIETCHGRNHVLGARITLPEGVKAQWWLALEDHLDVQWHIDTYLERLHKELVESKFWDEWEKGWKTSALKMLQEKARMTYAEMKRYIDSRGWAGAAVHAGEARANRKPPTREELRANGVAVHAAVQALHQAVT
jgi:hypothetical protein